MVQYTKGGALFLPGAIAPTRYAGGTVSGAPVTGTFQLGDFIVDESGAIWVCTAAGTPGTWVNVGGGGGGAVSSVFTRTGAVVASSGDYTVGQVTGAAPLASPALTGTPTAPTPAALDSSTQIGTTAYTDSAVGVEKTRAQAAEALLAPLASPTFTGTPAAPTAAPGDTSTQLATDAFVAAAVTAAVQGLAIKPSVQEATVAALPANTYSNGASGVGATLTAVLAGVLTVDGIAVALLDRVLVKNEVAAANNGIYVVTTLGTVSVAYILTRAADMNQAAEVPGAFTFVEAGTVNAGAGFTVAGVGPYVIGTTAINWTQFSGAGEITAGAGLTKTGNTLSLGVLTTKGDLIIENATPAPARLAIGSAGQQLGVSAGLPAYMAPNSWQSVYIAPAGALAETYPRHLVTISVGNTSGTLVLAAIGLPAGLTVTNIIMCVGATAKTGGTHGWYAILDKNFLLQGVTADQTDAATVWGTVNTPQSLALAAPYVTTYAGLYYLGVMVAESAGTMPTFNCIAPLQGGINIAPYLGGTSTTGLTTPGTPGTTTYAAITSGNSTGKPLYGYVS